ncbi:hypothetical protein KAH27_08375 [bacterium]|nr:hypothetical protein [bacterium]
MKIFFYLLLLSTGAFACSVPVFRYALEYWYPDPYQLILTYDFDETNNNQKVFSELKKYVGNRSFIIKKIKSKNSSSKIVLKYPANKRIKNTVWEAPLSKQNLDNILQSPVRKKLINKIVNGDSLVFLLLEGNNPKQNDQIANIILKNIPILEKEIKLPHEYADIPKEDLQIYDTNIVFKLSMMRLSRTNSEENVFINVLTKSLPVSIYKKSQPIVFPVFGRGRMLAAIREKNLNTETLRRWCEYIAGECSCEIKSRNPGFDTFIPIGWNLEEKKELISEVILPPLSGFSEFMPPKKSVSTNSLTKNIKKKSRVKIK